MVNKLRPKKVKAPYRKYVAGQGFIHTRGFTSQEYDLQEGEELLEGDGSLQIQGPLVLPWEIQGLILQNFDRITVQHLLVCRAWYLMCIPLLYKSPRLSSKNYALFVSTIVDNRRKRLGENVKDLDLSTILQSGKNSSISKVLRRCSPSLEQFTAPQTSFGYAPLISLKACNNLKYLDLGLVSETVKLKELFHAIQNFRHLTHLAFPRSSVDCEGYQDFQWPPNLQYLKLSGGITNEFLGGTHWPKSITTLGFSSCPRLDEQGLYRVLSQIGDNLKHLYFHYPLPQLRDNSLDYVFRYCSNLISLQLMVDYCSKWAFSEHMLPPLVYPRPLRTIYLESSGSLGIAFKIHPDDFTIAIMEARLPHLKNISISSKLNWDVKSDDVTDLVSVFEDQGGSLYLSY